MLNADERLERNQQLAGVVCGDLVPSHEIAQGQDPGGYRPDEDRVARPSMPRAESRGNHVSMIRRRTSVLISSSSGGPTRLRGREWRVGEWPVSDPPF